VFVVGVVLFSDVRGTLLVMLFGFGLLADGGVGVIAVVVFCYRYNFTVV
jgi:hypothetical protein